MRKYDFNIELLKKISRWHIDLFTDGGFGLYYLNLCSDKRLSFCNNNGIIFQIYPFANDNNACNILNYYEVSKGNIEHDNFTFFGELKEWEQDIIFEKICNACGVDCNKYLNPSIYNFNKLLYIVSNADFDTLFNFIQSNKKLKEIFDTNYKKGYKWFASSNDGSFDDESKEIFDTKEKCYNDMRNAALEKTKWNTEFIEDFERPKKDLENDPMDTDYSDVTIGYDIKFTPTKITHESYSGKYTYVMKCVFVDADGKVLYGY